MKKELLWVGAGIAILTGFVFFVLLIIKHWGLAIEINAMRWAFIVEHWKLIVMSFVPMVLGVIISFFAQD